MPTTASRRPRVRSGGPGPTPRRRYAASLAVLLALTTACGGPAAPRDAGAAGDPSSAAAPAGAPGTVAAPPVPVGGSDALLGAVVDAPDVVRAVTRALGHRADALRGGDQAAYDDGLDPRDPAFVAQQAVYYANLRQLPLAALALVPDPATLVRDDAAYWVDVAVTMQLAGFDALPVTRVDRYRFTPTAGGRRYRLASVTDAAWEERHGVRPEPWEQGPVRVATGAGVLVVTDDRGAAAAAPLARSVEQGIAAVAPLVPYDWTRSVVVYAFTDDAYLRSLPELPGGDADSLDAVAVPVAAAAVADGEQPQVAATRLVLRPELLSEPGARRDRLLRHELTHVAIGTHDDHAPVWLAEGLAEIVSVQPQAPEDRGVPRAAIRAARAGFTELPGDDRFNDDRAAEHYALSWWACEQVVSVSGSAGLWTLLDRLEAAGTTGPLTPATVDEALVAVAGVNGRTLARKAGKLLLATFDAPPEVPGPTAPATPGA